MSTDPLFAALVLKNIRRGTALIVRQSDVGAAALVGAALWSPASRQIGWLVVAEAWRSRGIGTMLVDSIVAAAGAGPLRVVTFSPESAEKERARRFYANLGFKGMVLPTSLANAGRQMLVRD